MQLTNLGDKSILLTPQTATEESFILCLAEMIKAREAKFLNDHDLNLKSLVQDSQPLTEESQSLWPSPIYLVFFNIIASKTIEIIFQKSGG